MLYCKTFNSIQAGNVAQQYGLVLALHVQGPGLLPATTKNLNIHIGMEMKKSFQWTIVAPQINLIGYNTDTATA